MTKPSVLRRALLVLGLSLAVVASPWPALSTVSDTDTQTVTALGNGVTTNYTIGFTFQDNDHIRVYREEQSSTPYVRTLIEQGVGASKFTITGGDPGTTAVMGTAPTVTQRLFIQRETPRTQPVDYVETDAFPANDHEKQMDRSVLLLQEIGAETDRAVGLSPFSSATKPDIPDPSADKFLIYNHAATNLTLAPLTSPSSGDVLKFDGSAWSLFALDATLLSGLPPLPSANLFVGNGSGVATAVAVTGDIGISNAGVASIAAGAIVDADVNGSAAIARSKLATGTINHVLINDGSGVMSGVAPGTSGNILTSNGTAWVSTTPVAYWRVDANISGANVDLSASDVTSYAGLENGSLTLTNNSGNGVISCQIPCSGTNAPTGTTCSSGNESIGCSFNLPSIVDVLACVSFTHHSQVGSGATGGTIEAAFQIVETPSNAQTISQEGKTRLSDHLSLSSIPTQPGTGFPHRLCGTFTFASSGQKTLRLFYEQDIATLVDFNRIFADAAASIGQRDIHWEVYPLR